MLTNVSVTVGVVRISVLTPRGHTPADVMQDIHSTKTRKLAHVRNLVE